MSSRIKIHVGDGLEFADLHLQRKPDGAVSFDVAAIAALCQASGIDPALFDAEDAATSLIAQWYRAHRRAGGPLDAVMEDILEETALEEAAGQHFSFKPGRA